MTHEIIYICKIAGAKQTYISDEAKNRIIVSLEVATSCNASAQLVDKGTECSVCALLFIPYAVP